MCGIKRKSRNILVLFQKLIEQHQHYKRRLYFCFASRLEMSSHICWVNWLLVAGGSMCVNWLVFYICRIKKGGCGTKSETDPDRCDPSCGDLSVWPLDAGLHHVAGHQLESLLQMFGELGLRPVEVQHEHLQSVQLPEQILRGGRAVTAGRRETTAYHKHNNTYFYMDQSCCPTWFSFCSTRPQQCEDLSSFSTWLHW